MFGALVGERFYHVYSALTTFIAVLSNVFLICATINSNVKHVGPYRFLIITFAFVEISISLVHVALIPALHLSECGAIFWGYRVLHLTTEQGVWASMLWLILFYQTFVLTAFHYVYRFVLLCKPPWLAWIQRNPWRNWIGIAVVYDVLFIGTMAVAGYHGGHPDLHRNALAPVMMSAYHIDLMAPNKPGFLGVVYCTKQIDGSSRWLARSLYAILIIVAVFSTSVFALVYCLAQILRELSPSILRLNADAFRLQRQLFRALLWQTIISIVTSYIPIAFICAAPLLTDAEFGGLGTLGLLSTQIFPMVDPIIVLFYVQGYRNAFPELIRKFIHKTMPLSAISQTSSVAPRALVYS